MTDRRQELEDNGERFRKAPEWGDLSERDPDRVFGGGSAK